MASRGREAAKAKEESHVHQDSLQPEIMASMLPEDFPAEKLSRPQHKMVVDRDVMVVVRDGVHIAVDVFRPDAPGEFPSLFSASPYNKDLAYLPSVPTFHMRETNDFEYFVSRGYAYVHMDVRGTGKSVEGQWQLFSPDEQRDLHDVIEWIAAQPWCTGKVGMIGESYPGIVQWFAAAQEPPHLACIVPYDAVADVYRENVYHGGMLAVGFVGGWHTTEILGHYRLGRKGEDPRPGDWYFSWNLMQHQTFDGFWEVRRVDLRRSGARCSASASSTRWASTCGATSAATKRSRFPRSSCSATATSKATRWPYSTRPRCAFCCCAGTTTGSKATTPA